MTRFSVGDRLYVKEDWEPKFHREVEPFTIPAGSAVEVHAVQGGTINVVVPDFNLNRDMEAHEADRLFTRVWRPDPLHPIDKGSMAAAIPAEADAGRQRRRR